MSIYLDLTRQFNAGRVRAILSSGLAVVFHRLAKGRTLMHASEDRLRGYLEAAQGWREAWPEVEAEIAGMPLTEAHAIVVRRAEGLLPRQPVREKSR